MDEDMKRGRTGSIVMILLTISSPFIMQVPSLMHYPGGIQSLLLVGFLLCIFGSPIFYLQMAFGKYAKSGPYGLWRAFPLGTGIGVVWIIMSFVAICQEAVQKSRAFVHLFAVFSVSPFSPILAMNFPWMKCNQSWNSANCQLMFQNVTKEEEEIDRLAKYPIHRQQSVMEYDKSLESFDAPNIVALMLTWMLISVPLIKGPKSLVKGIILGFLIIYLVNILMMFLALSLPEAMKGFAYIFTTTSDLSQIHDELFFLRMIFGYWFMSQFGSLILLGKYTKGTKFSFCHILVTFVLFITLSMIQAVKTSGFLGFYKSIEKYGIFFNEDGFVLTSIPALLTQTYPAQFWLLLHYISVILSWCLPLSFAVEVVATSITEAVTCRVISRTKVPDSLILTVGLGVLGFFLSLLMLFLSTADELPLMNWGNRYKLQEWQELFYLVFLFFITFAIVPLGLSRVANIGREDFLSFMSNQGPASQPGSPASQFGCSWGRARKVIAIIGLFLLGISVPSMLFVIARNELGWIIRERSIFGIILLCATLLIVTLIAIVHCFSYRRDPSKYPCCLPFGRKLVVEPEEMPLESEEVKLREI